jgi:hypothetical protein
LPTFYAKVQEQAPGARMGFIQVQNPSDGNARVTFSRASADSVAHKLAPTGPSMASAALLTQGAPESAAMMTSFTFVGLHMGNFAGPWLRWLYFAFGVAGGGDRHGLGDVAGQTPAQARQERAYASQELRLVEVLNIASMSGLLLGVAAFFWANRLPVTLQGACRLGGQCLLPGLGPVAGPCRAAPGRRAWGEQLALGALAFALLPLLNALTTGQGLNHSIAVGDWAMAGFDLTALGTGLFLAWARQDAALAPKAVAKRAPKVANAVEVS